MRHFQRRCQNCDTVIDQCRCMSNDKEIIYDTCEDCKDARSEFYLTTNELARIGAVLQEVYQRDDGMAIDMSIVRKVSHEIFRREMPEAIPNIGGGS